MRTLFLTMFFIGIGIMGIGLIIALGFIPQIPKSFGMIFVGGLSLSAIGIILARPTDPEFQNGKSNNDWRKLK